MTIYTKILEAQKAIGYVPKNGKNTFHKYDYAMEADILDTVKSAANEAGLIIATSTTSEIGHFPNEKGETIRWAKVTLAYQVVDAETGEKVEGTFDGYAEDKGDKAIYKATTGSNKYFLMKFFGVATGDDPERDEQPAPKGKPAAVQAAGDPTLGTPEGRERIEKQHLIESIKGFRQMAGLDANQAATLLKFSNPKAPTLDELQTGYDYMKDLLGRKEKGNLTNEELAVIQGEAS